MRILVDHGAFNNLGDLAMLEAVVLRLLRLSEKITLDVRDRGRRSRDLGRRDRVTPRSFEIPDTSDSAPSLRRLPHLWRYDKEWRALWQSGSHALLNRMIEASRLRLRTGDTDLPVGQFCASYDALHLVGGGYLASTFGDEVWQKCCLIHAFAAQGKPVLLTGQQLGPVWSRGTRSMLRSGLRHAAFVGLREPADSLTFCQSARVAPRRYAIMGDDSFGLPPADPALVNAYLSRRGLTPGRFLAVNLRVGSYVGATQDYVRPFAKLVSRLARHYELPLVVVPLALNEDDSDITSGHQLARMVEGSSVHVLDDPELDARLVKGILGKAHAAVGVSYHFCTFALSQGVPAICTFAGDYYGQKARGLAGFWKDSRLLLALEGCGTPTALAAATALFDDEPFRDALRARAARAVSRWARIFDHVTETALLGPGARAWVNAVFAVEEQG